MFQELITRELLSALFKTKVKDCGLTYIFGSVLFRYKGEKDNRTINIYELAYKHCLNYIKDKGYSIKIFSDVDKLYNQDKKRVSVITRDGVTKFRSKETDSELLGIFKCVDYIVNKDRINAKD